MKEAFKFLWVGLKFAFVFALAFIGAIFHALKPKRRKELPEDHWI